MTNSARLGPSGYSGPNLRRRERGDSAPTNLNRIAGKEPDKQKCNSSK
ncbi:hypothetical protein AG1IA_06924 [Rhizoctonia solani AG-1 IA]|uniref:Uncharacterized protein n=1 Tax=Thanatephorus cucumeris (strain AG1-IA) TaxID=983506 RepID=L8WQK4_THACA|nr:hypothetical protein AG1IA_06924 [Rhizoctonia solani AG-1 IA]